MDIEKQNEHSRLKELGESNFEISEHQSDIRGWIVIDGQNRTIGKVKDLLFDTQSYKVRYLVLNLENNELDLDERPVLIPIGLAQLNSERDEVSINNVSQFQLDALPTYETANVNPGVENMVRNVFSDSKGTSGLTGNTDFTNEADFYDHHHFNTQTFYSQQNSNPINKSVVVGVFDDILEAETAINQLLHIGIDQQNIDMSSGNADEFKPESSGTTVRHNSFTNFISDTISDEEEIVQSSEVGRRGIILTVHLSTDEEIKSVFKILNENGAVEVNERMV